MRLLLNHIFALSVLLSPALAGAAVIELRHEEGGTSPFTTELGDTLRLEVAIDAGEDEISGYAFFISYDPTVFSLVPAGVNEDGEPLPFVQTDYLDGIVLVNQLEEIEGEAFLNYAKASGSQRFATGGRGVAARFSLAATRRPTGDMATIRVEERGHDHTSHFVTVDAPGTEKHFSAPLGTFGVRITGFRILPLPDVVLIEGEQALVFDLDDFIDQEVGEVLWTHSILSEISTTIDAATREVTMVPEAGLVGQRQMRFTAGVIGEEPAVEIIDIDLRSRPKISGFPDTIIFVEDGSNQDFDFDAFVDDLDDPERQSQTWTTSGEVDVQVQIAAGSGIALFTAAPDWFGEERIFFTVRDEHDHSDTTSALVVVEPVNDPPEVRSIPPVYPEKNGEPVRIPLDELVADKDDEVGNLRVAFDPFEGGVRAEVENDELVIFGDEVGRGIVRFTVRDLAGAADSSRQVAVVLAPGESVGPEIGILPPLRFRGGQSATLDLNAYVRDDAPPNALQWSAEPDSVLTASVSNGVLSVGGVSGFAGTASVQLAVRDQDGNEDRAQVIATVLTAADNLGPEILDIGKVGLLAGGDEVALNLDELVLDPDHQPGDMNWEIGVSDGLQQNFDVETRLLHLSAEADFAGLAEAVLSVADPNGNSASRSIPVLVANTGGGPQMRPLADVVLNVLGDQETIDLDNFAFDDADRDAELSWSVSSPEGVEARIDPVSHQLDLSRTNTAGAASSVQLVLQVTDTNGQSQSAFLNVGLPPIFDLSPLPDIEFFAGQEDDSLVLGDFVLPSTSPPPLVWQVEAVQNLEVEIDQTTSRVRFRAKSENFVGTETVTFTATDQTQRWRQAQVRVFVRSKGLTPQVLDFGDVVVHQGENLTLILDNFVVDDDAPEDLQWTVGGGQTLDVVFDAATRQLSLDATQSEPGRELIQLLVRDPAGNTTLAALDVRVLAGGAAPVINALPSPLVAANGQEQRILGLDAYVEDADTPDEQISWEVAVGPGVSARVEDRQLFVTIPIGQRGSRQVFLTARDPDGNEVSETVDVLVLEDQTLPEFAVEVKRHPVFSELVEIKIVPSEDLQGLPQVDINGQPVAVEDAGDGTFTAVYQVPDVAGAQFANVLVRGIDNSGNEGVRNAALALHWMDEGGGRLTYADLQLGLNVPNGASGTGRLASIYRLDEKEAPAGHEGQPVYDVRLGRDDELKHPISLDFLVGPTPEENLGVLRWNGLDWEALPTRFDPQTGTLAATVTQLGLFRLGKTSTALRRAAVKLESYPNPFNPDALPARFVYELARQGRVHMELFNMSGQPIRTLVDQVQDVGLWTAVWDGRDADGNRLASGVYFCEFEEGGERHCLKFTMLRSQ